MGQREVRRALNTRSPLKSVTKEQSMLLNASHTRVYAVTSGEVLAWSMSLLGAVCSAEIFIVLIRQQTYLQHVLVPCSDELQIVHGGPEFMGALLPQCIQQTPYIDTAY